MGRASEAYTLSEIAIRDESTCGICGDLVDLELSFPDVMSASIDHVIPLSRGGDDTKANVQLAHFGCNCAKGARMTAGVV